MFGPGIDPCLYVALALRVGDLLRWFDIEIALGMFDQLADVLFGFLPEFRSA